MLFVLWILGVEPSRALALYHLQFVSHTCIDYAKGRATRQFSVLQTPHNPLYWVVFGLDQYAHATIIVLMWHFSGIVK